MREDLRRVTDLIAMRLRVQRGVGSRRAFTLADQAHKGQRQTRLAQAIRSAAISLDLTLLFPTLFSGEQLPHVSSNDRLQLRTETGAAR